MKVLFIANYRDGTGWAHAAIDSILALDAAGIEVVARPIKFNNVQGEIPGRLLELEGRRGQGADAVIQYTLPHHYDFCGRIPKNIGYYFTETDRFDGTNWPQKINTMDQAWVSNQDSKEASLNSGVTAPIQIVPCAANLLKYQKRYNPLPIRERFGDSFIFYYIGEFNKRKNIPAIIKSFHLEFDVNEPVNLVIKTDINENDPIKKRKTVTDEIDKIKTQMKLYKTLDKYKKEIILLGRYTDEEIMRLHASCDCFVCPSMGEGWCLPAFDAMSMGKVPIVTAHGGFTSYITSETGWLIPYHKEPVFGMVKDTFDDMFTSRENWAVADITSIRECMRHTYENKSVREVMADKGRERAYDFSYLKVGNIMKGLLENGSHGNS